MQRYKQAERKRYLMQTATIGTRKFIPVSGKMILKQTKTKC